MHLHFVSPPFPFPPSADIFLNYGSLFCLSSSLLVSSPLQVSKCHSSEGKGILAVSIQDALRAEFSRVAISRVGIGVLSSPELGLSTLKGRVWQSESQGAGFCGRSLAVGGPQGQGPGHPIP